jgi:FkbM family methyltransferase
MNKIILFSLSLVALNMPAELDKRLIRKYVPENPVIVEGGAHIGLNTLTLVSIWPKATVYAFEPHPQLFARLTEKVYTHSNIICSSCALSKQTGTAQFYVSGPVFDQSSSLLQPKEHLRCYPQVTFKDPIEVNTINLDEWAESAKVNRIDLLYLSLQGCEFDVLRAAPKIIKKTKCIYLHIAYCQLYEGSHVFSEVRPWLEAQGFKMVSIDSFSRVEGTALFVNENL